MAHTSKHAGKAASKVLHSKRSTPAQKTVAGSDLRQRPRATKATKHK